MNRMLILGIGNVLWADEGFGVRVVQALQRNYDFPESVRLMDGGTQGLALLPYVQEADTLIIADAVDFKQDPGTLVELRDGEVPAYLGAKKMSLHQVSFQEVLALSELLGHTPQRLYLVGVQPCVLEDYGGSLSEPVKAMLEPAIARILQYLAELGIMAEKRTQAEPDSNPLGIAAYEGRRPSAGEACRVGDERFLALRSD
jgi:hydrogenase maturation protease